MNKYVSVEFSSLKSSDDNIRNQPRVNAEFVSDVQQEETGNNNDDAIYQNLAMPIKQLPAYIQKMKERGDGFQKEFQVSHCYVCL